MIIITTIIIVTRYIIFIQMLMLFAENPEMWTIQLLFHSIFPFPCKRSHKFVGNFVFHPYYYISFYLPILSIYDQIGKHIICFCICVYTTQDGKLKKKEAHLTSCSRYNKSMLHRGQQQQPPNFYIRTNCTVITQHSIHSRRHTIRLMVATCY